MYLRILKRKLLDKPSQRVWCIHVYDMQTCFLCARVCMHVHAHVCVGGGKNCHKTYAKERHTKFLFVLFLEILWPSVGHARLTISFGFMFIRDLKMYGAFWFSHTVWKLGYGKAQFLCYEGRDRAVFTWWFRMLGALWPSKKYPVSYFVNPYTQWRIVLKHSQYFWIATHFLCL